MRVALEETLARLVHDLAHLKIGSSRPQADHLKSAAGALTIRRDFIGAPQGAVSGNEADAEGHGKRLNINAGDLGRERVIWEVVSSNR
jgi:hypothetical protein